MSARPSPPPSQIKESNTREGLFFAPFPFYIFVLTFLSFSLYVTFCEPFFWVRAKPIKKLLRSTFFSLNVLREIFSSTQRIKYCHKINKDTEDPREVIAACYLTFVNCFKFEEKKISLCLKSVCIELTAWLRFFSG